jgi:hypothetical protein
MHQQREQNMRSHWWFAGTSSFLIPAGVIIGFDGVTIPDDYAAYTDADGKVLLGTTTTDVGTTGGSNTIFSGYSGYGGSHNGGTGQETANHGRRYNDTGYSHRNPSNDAGNVGSHRHSISARYYPKTDNIVLIKATVDSRGLPSGAIVFGQGSIEELTLFDTFNNNQGILEANTSIGTTAASGSISFNSASYSHDHKVSETWTAWGIFHDLPTAMGSSGPSHGHSWSPPYSYSKKVVVLRALKAAADVSNLSGSIIALFDGTTVPDGWYLCDGTNSTPDMSDRYLESHTDGDGSVSGTSHAASVSETSGSSSHNHSQSGYVAEEKTSPIAHTGGYNHNHSASGSSGSFYPPWFKMKFIMLGV